MMTKRDKIVNKNIQGISALGFASDLRAASACGWRKSFRPEAATVLDSHQ